MLLPLQVTRDVHSQQFESCDAFHRRAAQADGRRRVLENRSDQQLFRLPAVHYHAGVSRLLDQLVDEWLHAADCRPVQNLSPLSSSCRRRTCATDSPVAASRSKSRTSVGQGMIPAACQPITAANLAGRRQSSRVVVVVAKCADLSHNDVGQSQRHQLGD